MILALIDLLKWEDLHPLVKVTICFLIISVLIILYCIKTAVKDPYDTEAENYYIKWNDRDDAGDA